MTKTTATGAYYKAQGDALNIGDFVRVHGTWYRLTTLEATHKLGRTMTSRQFLGIGKDGGHYHIRIDDNLGYVSYVINR